MFSKPVSDAKAIFIVLLCYLTFSMADGLVKYLSAHFSPITLLFWTGVFTLITMLVYGYWRGFQRSFTSNRWRYHLFKGSYNVIFGIVVVYALGHTTFAEYYMIIFTAPMWVIIFSMLMLKEPFDKVRTMCVLMGFSVIIYVFAPSGEMTLGLGALATLSCAICAAFNMIYIRKYLRGEPPALLGGVSATMQVLALMFFAVPQTNFSLLVEYLPYFALAGVGVFSAVVLLANAYHAASHAAILAPFQYSQMVYGVIIGFLVFSEVPTSRTMVGSLTLMFIGLGLFWYDYNNKKSLKKYA